MVQTSARLTGRRIGLRRLPHHGVVLARWLRHASIACFGAVLLVACQVGLPFQDSPRSPTELAEATTEWRIVPTSRAYINIPDALIVLQRDLGTATEQRITLPNATSLAGENVIMLRAQTSRSASTSRLVLTDALTQFGGAPAPFTGLTDGALTTTTDTYGDIAYSTRDAGGGITCVLALRRTTIGGRGLPRGTSNLDLMLRNCVSGSAATALAPIGVNAFGLGRGS